MALYVLIHGAANTAIKYCSTWSFIVFQYPIGLREFPDGFIPVALLVYR